MHDQGPLKSLPLVSLQYQTAFMGVYLVFGGGRECWEEAGSVGGGVVGSVGRKKGVLGGGRTCWEEPGSVGMW